MEKDKVEVTLELERDHAEWLAAVVDKYGFPDESKAARVLLDFALQDGDEDLIFAPENMRCRHCD